jgi:acyl-CoA dehydrogenase
VDRSAGPGFALDPAQERLLSEVATLAREVLAPLAAAGRPGRVNRALVAALGDHGLLPRLFPKAAGGAADGPASALELCLLREALAAESTEAETALALQALGAYPILAAGGEALKRRFLPAVAAGRAVAAFALSEAGAGSDAGALELRAEPDGNGFRLTGAKQWISNAPDADVYAVFARTTAGARSRGVTAFAVPGDAPGLSGQPLELLAPHPVGRLSFDGVPVAADQVLGTVDGGFAVAMETLDRFRPSVGACAVGMAKAALDLALGHAARRRAFGRPLRDFQAVSHRLAEMATRTQAARLLVYAAASRYDAGDAGVTEASAMAKLYATETAQAVVDAAVQVHGALALQRGHPLEHLYREVRAPRIYEGTSEIQREVIARELFARHSRP